LCPTKRRRSASSGYRTRRDLLPCWVSLRSWKAAHSPQSPLRQAPGRGPPLVGCSTAASRHRRVSYRLPSLSSRLDCFGARGGERRPFRAWHTLRRYVTFQTVRGRGVAAHLRRRPVVICSSTVRAGIKRLWSNGGHRWERHGLGSIKQPMPSDGRTYAVAAKPGRRWQISLRRSLKR
jgi:hypothetical protein